MEERDLKGKQVLGFCWSDGLETQLNALGLLDVYTSILAYYKRFVIKLSRGLMFNVLFTA